MPEYVALRCYSCGTFQSHQLRKDSKFKCTICGASQSYRKVYCRSFKPNDVRSIVQDYNMRRGEIDQQEAAEARKAMERKQAIVEEGGESTSNSLVHDENPWGEYEAEEARNKKEEELAQAGDNDTITTELPIAASAGRGRGRGRGQPKGWEVVSGSKANTKQGKRTREEENDNDFTQSNSGSRMKNKKQSTNTNSYNSNAFRDRTETSGGAYAPSFSQPRSPPSINSNNNIEKLNGLNASANNSRKGSLSPSVLLTASPGDLERQKRLERAEMMKRQFQERMQAQQQADNNSSGLAISNTNSSSSPQLPRPTNNIGTGSSVPNFRPPISNIANINRRPVSLSAKPQAQPKSEWDEYLDVDEQPDRSDSEDDLVFEQEQNSAWETL